MWRSCPCSELLLLDVWSGQGYDDSCAFAEPEKIPMDTLKSFRAPHEQCSPSARSSHRASHLQRGVKDRKRSDRSQRRESITTRGDINDHYSMMDPHLKLSPEAVKDCLGRGRGSLLNQFPHQNQPPPPGFDSTTIKRVPVPRPKLPDHRFLPCNPSHSSEKPFPLERKFPHGLIIPQKVQTKQFDINTKDQGDQYAVPTGHSMSSQFTPPVRSPTSPDSTRGRGILRMPHFNRPGHMTSASSCRHMSPYKFNPGHSNRDFEDVQRDIFEESTIASHEPLKSSKGMTKKRCVLGANNQIKKSCENMDIARKATSDRPMSYVERLQLEEEIIRKTNLSAYGAENLEKCKNLKMLEMLQIVMLQAIYLTLKRLMNSKKKI
ncbi:hypothetical protein FSP39_024390 [Pinctada imbricata]|uniref:Uncharacterized protein n=1 Tax=Pinctada imbricata TaxID=66713 RepID=A0AA89BV34_PINIB|nr:hypothetical protein FSP39_024390 [Pinctada imbricata]